MTPLPPLAGVRVVEIAGIGPTPFAAMLLAELGADVVRIDRLDDDGMVARMTKALNRSRPSIALDLKADGAAEVVLRLLDGADILIEGLRPGVMERLGLGPDLVRARNPRLIYGRMTGWGQDGPWAQRAGHDITYAAITGALHLVGEAERPIPPANVLADFGGGTLYLLVGLLSALHARESTGHGQVVDAAMVDGAASLITMIYGMYAGDFWRDERAANLLDGGTPFYDTYRCADGKHLAVGPLEPQFHAEFLRILDLELPGGQFDAARWPEHRALIGQALATRTRDEWAALFDGTDACVAPVLSLAEAPSHPHLVARGVFTEVDGQILPRVAPRFSDSQPLEPTPARAAGADSTAYLLGHGFTDAEVSDLLGRGVLRQA